MDAARAFTKCGDDAKGTQTKHRDVYLKIAAGCWGESGADPKAAEMFLESKCYALSAQHYHRAGLYDQMIDVLREHAAHVPNALKERLEDDAKYHYLVCMLVFPTFFDAEEAYISGMS